MRTQRNYLAAVAACLLAWLAVGTACQPPSQFSSVPFSGDSLQAALDAGRNQ